MSSFMKNNLIILENLRSAYNVWNIIRTADALWYDVVISGYTASPFTHPKVQKTSLWAQDAVSIREFSDTSRVVEVVKNEGFTLIACEICEGSIDVSDVYDALVSRHMTVFPVALVVWNEVTGVLQETRDVADLCVHIPMLWIKESLNVGQAAAICMWEINRK